MATMLCCRPPLQSWPGPSPPPQQHRSRECTETARSARSAAPTVPWALAAVARQRAGARAAAVQGWPSGGRTRCQSLRAPRRNQGQSGAQRVAVRGVLQKRCFRQPQQRFCTLECGCCSGRRLALKMRQGSPPARRARTRARLRATSSPHAQSERCRVLVAAVLPPLGPPRIAAAPYRVVCDSPADRNAVAWSWAGRRQVRTGVRRGSHCCCSAKRKSAAPELTPAISDRPRSCRVQ